ncbi:MAG TPA: GNAT family N-acetyltransferase [Thermoanaerobaculia bacterium]|nr:GNAT family N-acetyltransferase [Thermoanaerobaculia bacterium]
MILIRDAGEYLQWVPRLEDLFARAFSRTLPAGYLAWRFGTNPYEDVFVAIEVEGDRAVASACTSPCLVSWDGTAVRAGLATTSMTDRAYEGRGLFTKLTAACYDAMRESGYAMTYGFPNPNSHYPFTKKLAWTDIYEIPTMRLELAGTAASAVTSRYDDAFDLRYRTAPPIGALIHVVKDATWLRWRYAAHPANEYRNLVLAAGDDVSSFCVLKAYQDSVDIVDFQAASPEEGAELLRQAIAHAKGEGRTGINCWAPRHHFMHVLCQRAGFLKREPIAYFGARPFIEPADAAAFSSYSNWFVQMGDSDVF